MVEAAGLGQYDLDPVEIVGEFIALSVVESTYTGRLEISVEVEGARATITDSGRGMQLKPDEGDEMPHAQRALTSIYPIHAATTDANVALTELIWGPKGSLGPGVANARCPELRFWSRRDGEEWSQQYRNGSPVGPPGQVGFTSNRGTTVAFTTVDPIDIERLTALIDRLHTAFPTLRIDLRVCGTCRS